MYDAGGISLKPSDESHAQMKNDMTGAGAILSAVLALPALGCPSAVTAWLMCTDNMPSGMAMQLGDVLTTHGGTTVEVVNTDADTFTARRRCSGDSDFSVSPLHTTAAAAPSQLAEHIGLVFG